ncbi:hypothetical protein KHQ81_07070 [Mycoplasmatota bacterium]|nr:hypothetical protein KHQ81_07070 [Mycoplasmatota bacterium]
MLNNLFISFVEKRNWVRVNNIAHGKENDYLVTLYQGKRYILFILPLTGIRTQDKEQVLDYLKQHKVDFGLKKFSFDNTVLVFKVREPNRTIKIEKIEYILHSITQFLRDYKISLGKFCFICGQDYSDKKVTVTEIEYYTHETCYENLMAEIKQEEEDKKNKKNKKKIKY